ncbi:MAG: energy-coupling factor transporter transmembrane protein EcfT [Hyphomicrobiales bacterium]|nr:energy-coupling factor transporter transmembrane protein EcfT [Hyphomicrobiales bacterium]
MIEGLGGEGQSWFHRLPAGVKLIGLAALATALFLVEHRGALAGAAGLALAALVSTGLGFERIRRALTGPLFVIAAVGAVDWIFLDGRTAATVALRLSALAFLAQAVVATTTTEALSEVFERALGPFDRLGLIDAARASLALTLALRFVPLIVEEATAIREAQAARGLSNHPIAVIVPLVVRTLVRAERIADAIDARGFPPQKNSNSSR